MLRFALTICVAFALSVVARAQAPAAPEQGDDRELLTNPRFEDAGEDGIPAGWQRRTRNSGFVRVADDAGDKVVQIGVERPGEDSFIQQVAKLPADGARFVVHVRYRWADIVKGEKGFQRGAIQARFTNGGKEVGAWIDLASLEGSGPQWVEKTRAVGRPKDVEADGLMLRLALYGVKSGRLDVSTASITYQTADQVAAATAEARAQWRPKDAYGTPVSDARFARLARGVNINNWFGQPYNGKVNGRKGDFSAEHFRGFITDADAKRLRAAGITNVRLPVEPEVFMNKADGSLKPDLLPELDRAIKMLVDAGLAVQVDAHPKMPGLKGMAGKPDVVERYARWVGEFAAHLHKTTDPEWVFFELMNEPGGQGYYNKSWEAYQDRLITVARAAAPNHTLIVNGGGYMLWDKDTAKFDPHPDRNVVVAVHYYEPGQFTHQGATWMKVMYHPLRNVPWPCDESNLQQAVDAIVRTGWKDKTAGADEKAEAFLRNMVRDRLGTPAKMRENLASLADWGKSKGVRIVINECGVYAKYVKPEDRVRYLADMRTSFESAGFGWTLWDYCGDFGVAVGEAGERKFDPAAAAALGLKAE
jgi:hypothetical protein